MPERNAPPGPQGEPDLGARPAEADPGPRPGEDRAATAPSTPPAPQGAPAHHGAIHTLSNGRADGFAAGGLLRVASWNAAKGRAARFLEALARLGDDSEPGATADLILLQEARSPMGHATVGAASFAHSWGSAAQRMNGVMTLSPVEPLAGSMNLKSRARELGLASSKNCLITRYPVVGAEPLTVVNFHGINFRATAAPFTEQLADLAHALEPLAGPLIVGGDFNTWDRARLLALLRFARELGLARVRPPEGSGKRPAEWYLRAIGRPFRLDHRLELDHLLYRGLRLERGLHAPRWMEELDHSDHVPLWAAFHLPN